MAGKMRPEQVRVGQVVEAWSVYNGQPFFVGVVRHIIEPRETPNVVAMAELFGAQIARAALNPHRRPPAVPKRPGKHRRVVIVGERGKAVAVTLSDAQNTLVLLKDAV